MRSLFALLPTLLTLALTLPRNALAQPVVSTGTPVPDGALQLVVSAQLNGQWTALTCTDHPPQPALLSLASAFAGERDAFALDTGDLLGASSASRLAISWNADRFARALVSTGLRAMSLGARDLAAPRATLLAAARALSSWGIPYVLSNLECDPSQANLCASVRADRAHPPVLETPFGRVAVVSALSPAALATIPRDRSEGLRLTNPAEALTAATRAARADGARWVIAVFDPAAANLVRETMDVASQVSAQGRPDVLLVNDVSGVVAQAEAPRSGLRIVSTRPQQALVINVGRDIQTSPPILGIVPSVMSDTVSELRAHLCATEGQALPGGHLVRALPSDAFAALYLDVLREHTTAEVALAPRTLVHSRELFPIDDAVSALDLAAALPFDDDLMVGVLRGSELRGLVRAALTVRGATIEADVIRINGRLLDDTARYRVVTTRHLVEVGPAVTNFASRFRPYGTVGPRELFHAWLARPRRGDLFEALADPAFRTRWTFRANLDTGLSATVVTNAGMYTDAQLARAESTSFRGDLELRADADHPRYAFENQLRLRYGRTRTVSAGVDSGFVESLDLITLRNGFAWRGWRVGPPHWYVPVPYGELYTETEFSPPEGTPPPRTYHHLLLRPTAGVRLQLLEKLSLNFGFGLDWEVLAPDLRPAGVLVAGAQLLQMRLVRVGERWAEAQGSVDLSWRDPGGSSDVLLRSSLRVSVPLLEALAVTASLDVFGRSLNGATIGLATDMTLGLRFNLARSVQVFGY